MKGNVDDADRALMALQVRAAEDDRAKELTAWIDTAFTGELVVPRAVIDRLQLPQSAAVMARLADGSDVVLETCRCLVEWFGESRIVEVIENDGMHALLGVGMFVNRRIEIDYRTRSVVID